MNPPNKEGETNCTAAAATNNESAVLGATASIGQDSHGDDGEPRRPAAANGAGLEIIEDEDGPWIPPAFSTIPFDGDSPDLDAARTAASRYVGKPTKAGAGLEIIEDEDGPLIPPAFSTIPFDGDSPDLDAARTAASRYVEKPTKARPEEIKDNAGQDIPVSMMEFTDSKKMEPIVTRPPKKGQPPPRQEVAREDSIVIPPSEDMEGEVAQIITNRRGGRAEEFLLNANASPSNPGAHRNEDEEANVQNGNPEDTLPTPDLERDSMFKVPEAVLVEEVDDEVYMGEPVDPPLPWWKQRRMRFLLSLMFVFVAISAIIIGSLLSGEPVVDPIVIVVVASNAPSSTPTLTKSNAPSTSVFPSITTSPSLPPSIAPSSSVSPSTSPSSPPSMTPLPSTSPTETSCYWLTIAIDYDEKPEETNWYLWRAVDGGFKPVISHSALEGDTSYSKSICLEEGEYEFTIEDDDRPYDGICCDHGEGSYNVTVKGTLIVEGGEFPRWEGTRFSLPFVAGTNVTTQYVLGNLDLSKI